MEVKCNVCGVSLSEENAVTQEYEGEEYYFCSDECRIEFIKDPHKYIGQYSSRRRPTTATLLCAVCGSPVSEEKATKQEYQEERSYEKYYFCSGECRIEFIKDPHKYAGESGKHLLA
jgi:YHS domain-containing protein